MAEDTSSVRRGARPEQGAGRIHQTTLLDLLMGIDEMAESEQESLATATRLLRGGRVRVVSKSSELAGTGLSPRTHLRDLIASIDEEAD